MRRADSAFWPPPSLLLPLVFAVIITATVSSPLTGECVLCRQCGADVSDGVHIVNQFSPSALVRGNQSLFGARDVQVQVLENPLGVRFRVVTFTKASCGPGHTWHNEHSWFPGYIWRHCLCPRCGHHLGCFRFFNGCAKSISELIVNQLHKYNTSHFRLYASAFYFGAKFSQVTH